MQNGGSNNLQNNGLSNAPHWREEIDAPLPGNDASFDKAAAWESLSRRLQNGDKQPAGKRHFLYPPYQKAAAAVVVLAISAGLVYLLAGRQDTVAGKDFPDPVVSLSTGNAETPVGNAVTTPGSTVTYTDNKEMITPGGKAQKPRSINVAGSARRRKSDPRQAAPLRMMPATITPSISPAPPAIVIDAVAMSSRFTDPLTIKKRKVVHLNEISTPRQLLDIQTGKDQRRMSFFNPQPPAENRSSPNSVIILFNH